MILDLAGQRCVSEREPELGLGLVSELDHNQITIEFPATRERRIYARGTPVLKRVRFKEGDRVATRAGASFTVEAVIEDRPASSGAGSAVASTAGRLLVYVGNGGSLRVPESEIADAMSANSPADRLLTGLAEPAEVFDLRYRTLQWQAELARSELRGMLGGRVDLIAHQFYILSEVSRRQIPRVLLSDEVGLGKTIEACLILQRLLATGRVKRALILVPESLVHQWFVELLRRFNLWFTIFDEARAQALEASGSEEGAGGADAEKANPFLSSQLALAAIGTLAENEKRRAQTIAAGWDLVIVDEAHHLGWSPQAASPDYQLVEALAQNTPGLLLLTATPNQLGSSGHFARLRLLDPHRYSDYQAFLEETEGYASIAGIADALVEGRPLSAADHQALLKIFDRDPQKLSQHLSALESGGADARAALLRTLLDQHGTGRMVFRNTRAAMRGFPKRKYQPAPIEGASPEQLAQVAREILAEESGEQSPAPETESAAKRAATRAPRYSFKGDPRLAWLIGFLKKHAREKVLLICKTAAKALALETAIKEQLNLNLALFHEGLSLIHRDRQAAWFAEPDGAQLLICSEIGSEGRNFQFAHHLVLFDLPLNPGLVEQRIGRLDRIGQSQTIRIHVPYLVGGADEAIARWYHHGLAAFETPLHGGNDYRDAYHERLLALVAEFGEKATDCADAQAKLETLIAETEKFRAALNQKLAQGRDRLLELNSYEPTRAAALIEKIRAADSSPTLRENLSTLLDHFGVRVVDHEAGDVSLDASQAYVEGFPAIPAEGGLLATYSRARAIAREDIGFLSADHPLVQDTIDLLIKSPTGTTAFCLLESDTPNLLLEAVFVLETVEDTRWHLDQFLPPTPLRVLVDIHGRDRGAELPPEALARDLEDAPLPQFLEKPGFNATLLKNLLEGATELAEAQAAPLRQAARETAAAHLTAELQRLVDLSKLNDNVSNKEIELAKQQVRQTRKAIEASRLRLDSIRLILEGA
ncbi:helicase [Cephaloticoccus primus]|uniref:Helicase n=1 Tax=Cephaloticoccus primus TaxID=1548207 RepID=A0A139STA9_9BACT|nr:RNA polymerase-associated protein RapA [Cephaloticoccus primus]KXU37700.1 helicase [Cephaloticoccus primus]